MNVHQAGNALLDSIKTGTGYNTQVERNADGITMRSRVHKARYAPVSGELSDGESVTMLTYDRTVYIGVEAFQDSGFDPPRPMRGDIIIDVDHSRTFQIMPQENNRSFKFHGTDERMYMLLCKEDGVTEGANKPCR